MTGITGGYRLEAGATMPPLLLDDEEAVAIAVGLRTAAVGSVTGIQETSVRALAKLEQVLPPRLRRHVNTLRTYTEPLANPWPAIDPERLTLIARLCRDRRRLEFAYRPRELGDRPADEARLVEPYRLVAAGRRWYLLAWDVGRGDWRTFRVDRMDDPRPTGTQFAPRTPPADDAASYVARNIHTHLTRHRAVVTLHASTRQVVERVRTTEGYALEPLDDDSCLMRTEGDSLEYLALSIGMLGFEFDVHEPPELVEFVRGMSGRLARSTRVVDSGRPTPTPNP
jgi:predicted DNA-binding transcriptional regulator YafY